MEDVKAIVNTSKHNSCRRIPERLEMTYSTSSSIIFGGSLQAQDEVRTLGADPAETRA